ncbi:hypothetical protein CABS01_16065 [Colletotrichum abscissum]|uniref:Uncharacterized protein n=1 Tax=Colletotrichum abscissum TaxID=1671311 RepID=A0A9P9X3N4_9PEZI|nr:uncharacterized protein CABS01_16065 [Colletotrichum abscissum]KAI3534976.1 hypothetical protein CABS02_13073 [Colletotrichum abscissum]KAK1473164.1 hypothetical protein CABS01_16065 [Colletotrichum abscissum]
MAHPPDANTLAGAVAVAVTGAVTGVAGVQSWHHTLAPTLARLACLSPRHLPWPWKAWSSTLVQPISRDTHKPTLLALSPTVSRLLPFYHFIFGATLPTCALVQSSLTQSTCFVLVTMSLICKSSRQGGKGQTIGTLPSLLPRGPHVADSLPRTKVGNSTC